MARKKVFSRHQYMVITRALFARDGELCCWCSKRLTCTPYLAARKLPGVEYSTLEHLVPRSGGGPDRMENLVLACAACNTRRLAMPAGRFAQSCADRGLTLNADPLLAGLRALADAGAPHVSKLARRELADVARICARQRAVASAHAPTVTV